MYLLTLSPSHQCMGLPTHLIHHCSILCIRLSWVPCQKAGPAHPAPVLQTFSSAHCPCMLPSCSCKPPSQSVSLSTHPLQNWAPQLPLHVCTLVTPFSHPYILPDAERWDILSFGEEWRVEVCVKNLSEPGSTWTSGCEWHMQEFPL